MKLSVLQENFLSSLQTTSRIVSLKSQLPILQHVLLAVEENQLTITASNMDTTIRVWVGAKIQKEGSACIPSKVLTEYISSLSAGTIEIELEKDALSISGENTKASFATAPSAEFPPLPAVDMSKAAEVRTQTLKEALRLVLFAAATDEARPILAGVRITGSEDVSFVATDGYRLSVNSVQLQMKAQVDCTVPAQALREVLKNISEGEDEKKELKILITKDGQVAFFGGDLEIYSRIIEGEYPDYHRIIPKSFTTRVVCDRVELLKAVKTAAIFARDNANIIRLSIQESLLRLSANAPQVGENMTRVEARTEGEGGDIAFNSRFLIDVLSAIDSSEIVFEMTGSLNPGVFRIPDEDGFLHVVMPVRVQE